MRLLTALFFLPILCFSDQMDSAKNEGKTLGKSGANKAYIQTETFQHKDLTPSLEGETFDAKNAKNLVEKGLSTPSDVVNYLQSCEVQSNKITPSEDEYFLSQSEKIASSKEEEIVWEEFIESREETCRQSDAPYPIIATRTLHVEMIQDPGEIKEKRICKGHQIKESYKRREDAERACRRWHASLTVSPWVKTFAVSYKKKGFRDWQVKGYWFDVDDAPNCSSYLTETEVIRHPAWEEIGNRWLYEDKELLKLSQTPNCTFVEKSCIDSTPSKVINGKEIHRQCWKEKLVFLCKASNFDECPYFRDRNCELLSKECLLEGPYGCTLWEHTFRCFSKSTKSKLRKSDLFGMDENPDYEPNDSFPEVSAKFAVFEEIKHELQASEAHDARNVQVFKGSPMKCSKSIAEDMLYDCCFTYSGLAKKLKLAQCTEEELTLAEMREQNLCHYVGSYSEKFHGLWKSRTEHTFCCFRTKLGRVLQEQARQQLGLGWEEPKYANCRGLSIDEISSLDISKLDFSELYEGFETRLPEDFQTKLDSFQDKIQKKVTESV